MAHFAEIDENNIVVRVIVADQEFIDSGAVGDPKNWIQTSYNTDGGEHAKGGAPMRMNYAGVGFTYDKGKDAFIPPKPWRFPSYILDDKTCKWKPPVEYPTDGKKYDWDEEKINWILAE